MIYIAWKIRSEIPEECINPIVFRSKFMLADRKSVIENLRKELDLPAEMDFKHK
jgi:hypothetical protein